MSKPLELKKGNVVRHLSEPRDAPTMIVLTANGTIAKCKYYDVHTGDFKMGEFFYYELEKVEDFKMEKGEIVVIPGTNEVGICTELDGKGTFYDRHMSNELGKVEIIGKLTNEQARLYKERKGG